MALFGSIIVFCSMRVLPFWRTGTARENNPFTTGTDATATTLRFLWPSNPSESKLRETMAVVAGLLQSSFTEVLLGAVLMLFLHYVITSTLRLRREPPGPRPLPIIGNLLLLDLNRPYHSLYELSKTYGSVFKVHFGCKKVIVLAGYKTVKEALVNHATEFGDRDLSPVVRDLYNGHGIVFANGDSWKELRNFTLVNIQDFGTGKRKNAEKIMEEVEYLMEVFEKHAGTVKYPCCGT